MTTIDPPAVIAILGAGPIGIEAALYARFLGYSATVVERHEVAANLQMLRDQPLWGTFGENVTPLGLNALRAQIDDFQRPASDAVVTIGEWLDCYVHPLANSDLISDGIQTSATVVDIRPVEMVGDEYEEDAEHLEVTIKSSLEATTIRVSTVIDATGTLQPEFDLESLGVRMDEYGSMPGLVARFSDAKNDQPSAFSREALILEVPYLYCIGAKSFGTWSGFRLQHGFAQIRELFKILGDRQSLDLYAED